MNVFKYIILCHIRIKTRIILPVRKQKRYGHPQPLAHVAKLANFSLQNEKLCITNLSIFVTTNRSNTYRIMGQPTYRVELNDKNTRSYV